MQDLQSIYNRIQEKKLKFKEIKQQYKDALESTPEYQDIKDKLSDLKNRKKQLETQTRADMGSVWQEIDKIKADIATDQQMLSDIAMANLMNGKTVEITDSYDNSYEPIFSVRFRRSRTSNA